MRKLFLIAFLLLMIFLPADTEAAVPIVDTPAVTAKTCDGPLSPEFSCVNLIDVIDGIPVYAVDGLDISRISPTTKRLLGALKGIGNIKVYRTYKCATNYLADWVEAWVRITAAFVWTDVYGIVHIHAFTANPPMSLDGFTPGVTGHDHLDTNMDDTIPIQTREYDWRYDRWRTRPCVDLVDSIISQPLYANIWTALLNDAGGTRKYTRELEALGLNPETGRHHTDFDYIPEDSVAGTSLVLDAAIAAAAAESLPLATVEYETQPADFPTDVDLFWPVSEWGQSIYMIGGSIVFSIILLFIGFIMFLVRRRGVMSQAEAVVNGAGHSRESEVWR